MKLKIDLTQGKIKRNVFFTSDLHLFHNNVIRFDNRPFNNVFEMNQAIEDGWNEVVGPDDIVIYLGDLSFARQNEKSEVAKLINRLNGTIHFILGNHDKFDEIKRFQRFNSVEDYLEIKIVFLVDGKVTEKMFCCMHYPIHAWNKIHHGTYMVHGHCHGNLHHGEDASYYVNRRAIDVGCMLYDYKPIDFMYIMEKLDQIELPKITRSAE